MSNPYSVTLLALLALVGIAVVTDLRERRIPNWLTGSGVLIGLTLAAIETGGFPTAALVGVVTALAIAFPLFALGGVGAGDVKLLAAVGAFVGPGGLLPVIIYGGLAGGVLALGSAVRRGVLVPVLVSSLGLLLHLVTLGRRGERPTLATPGAHSVPYGVAIAVGAVAAWFFPVYVGGPL
jgi:prepilin peptidase CpaA